MTITTPPRAGRPRVQLPGPRPVQPHEQRPTGSAASSLRPSRMLALVGRLLAVLLTAVETLARAVAPAAWDIAGLALLTVAAWRLDPTAGIAAAGVACLLLGAGAGTGDR